MKHLKEMRKGEKERDSNRGHVRDNVILTTFHLQNCKIKRTKKEQICLCYYCEGVSGWRIFNQHLCILLTSSLSVRYGFVKSGAFSVIPSSCDICEMSGKDR